MNNHHIIDYFKIPTSNSRLDNYTFWLIIKYFIKSVYILIVNIRFLGRPSEDNFAFLESTYNQIFHENLTCYHKYFYYFYGKRLLHIYRYKGIKAGFGLFRINPIWTIHMCKFGIVSNLQGRGLAKTFLSESLDYWKREGFKRVSVYIDHKNYIARKTYESVGFETVDFLKTQILMEKKL